MSRTNRSMRERQGPGLKAQFVFAVLEKLTGHSKEIETIPVRRRPPLVTSPSRSSSLPVPIPLPPSLPAREHCLTPPSSRSGSPDPFLDTCPYDEQLQSPLLQRLPEEILMLIYEHAIGKQVLHIVRRQTHVGHAPCRSVDDLNLCRELKCRGLRLPDGEYAPFGNEHGGFVQLLQTCRKM
jgi:hypothetical protein